MKIFPNPEFVKNAYFKSFSEYKELYNYSMNHFEEFWASQAWENLTFFEDFTQVLDEKYFPKLEWFKGWKVNICYEAVDKNLEKNADKIALIFEWERWDSQKITYKELYFDFEEHYQKEPEERNWYKNMIEKINKKYKEN